MGVGNVRLKSPWRWLALLGAFFCCSCGPGGPTLYPVQGKVLQKGQPLAGVSVAFQPKSGDPKQPTSTGFTDDDGNFQLETGSRIGAPAGDYNVILIQSKTVAGKSKQAISMEPPETVDALKGAYATPAKSKLTATVKAGSNELPPFDLK